VTALSDEALRALIRTDPEEGWRAFIDQYTPLIVGLIRRAGLDDRDEMMEVYVLICERLSARGFERLKSQDVARGSLGGWLAVLTRHAAVDWIRSRRGRRRLFAAVRDLPPFDQRVFERYYWEDRSASEIAGMERADLAAVLEALERIQTTLSDRHRAELLSMAIRSKPPLALEETDAAERVADPQADPEMSARVAELNERFETALSRLPAEDAAIVRLKYVEGLTNAAIEHALGASGVTTSRLHDILGRLRSALVGLGVDARDIALVRGQP
jgi:DNA-directed RNA polymerase specialized sigma24 family protein